MTVTETLPPETVVIAPDVTVEFPPETVTVTQTVPPITTQIIVDREVPVTYTVTTDALILTTIRGEPVTITTHFPYTVTTTACPSGYVIKPGHEELGCIYFEDAKDLSIGGDSIGGVSLGFLAFIGVVLGIYLYQNRRRSK